MKIDIHPELRKAFRRMPTMPMHHRWFVKVAKVLMKITPTPKAGPGVTIEDRKLQRAGVRIYRPLGAANGACVLWIHGGGLLVGAPKQDDRRCGALVRDLNVTVVSARYRLAPDNRFPAAIDDCFEVWQWLQQSARELGVDPGRVAISGQSAGGGLAACLAQRIHDSGGVQPASQVLFCPMLDDRTALRRELDSIEYPLWPNRSNRAGWSWYLGRPAGSPNVAPYAAAARRDNLAGLPPTWMSVGDAELFHDEVVKYAQALQAAGVRCVLEVVAGGPHAFETLVPDAAPSRKLMQSACAFMEETLRLQRRDQAA